jgi:SAM-dependent methyltransferase
MKKTKKQIGNYAHDARLFQRVESIPGEQALYEQAKKEVQIELDRLKYPVTIIDFCCGTCEIFSRMVPKPEVNRFIGVDIERSYLDFAGKRFEGAGNVELLLEDAVDCHLGANADIIIASSAYHHIEDGRKIAFLRNVMKHMKPDAKVVFAENILPAYEDEKGHAESARLFYGKRIEEAHALGMEEEVIRLLHQVMDFEVRREYEWKVDYKRFMKDLERAGFLILRKSKVWPVHFEFNDPLAGDYVFVAEIPAEYM